LLFTAGALNSQLPPSAREWLPLGSRRRALRCPIKALRQAGLHVSSPSSPDGHNSVCTQLAWRGDRCSHQTRSSRRNGKVVPSSRVQKRWGGRSGSLDARHARRRRRRPGACPSAQQAIVIIRLRTTDDMCDLPVPPISFPLPHTHSATHTTSAPIARFCLLACCRTLSSRSAAAAAVTFTRLSV
jgi:hypothetical protein